MAVDVKLLFDANILNANKEQNDFKQVLCAMEKADTRKQSQILIELYHTEISFLLQLELIIHVRYFIVFLLIKFDKGYFKKLLLKDFIL